MIKDSTDSGMTFWDIDHTKVDTLVECVDKQEGRPVLEITIDTITRKIINCGVSYVSRGAGSGLQAGNGIYREGFQRQRY